MTTKTPTTTEIQTIHKILAQTPRRILYASAPFSDERLHAVSNKKSWSAADILAHLRACSDVWTHSIYAMLSENEPELLDIDERRWAKTAKYSSLNFQRSVKVFESTRNELLRVLRDLPEVDWTRRAIIAGRTHTIYSQARRMAKHESEHCAQLEAVTSSLITPEDNLPGPDANVTLREIDAETVRAICRLTDTLTEGQRYMVAPNAISIAQAHFSEHAWFRAVYAGETPVGYIMLYIGPDDVQPKIMVYYLWRYMIAGPYQGKGYGRQALGQVIHIIKEMGAVELFTSCGQGDSSPEGFYRSLGFERTGEMVGDEIELVKKLTSKDVTE